jgi:hypothetical protein
MIVLPVIVLKCTKQTTKQVFRTSKKGLFYLCVNNDIVLVTTVEDKIDKYAV